MKLRIFRNKMPQIILIKMHWTLMGIMLLQQMKTTDAVKYKGDNCMMKNQPGICRELSECPVINTLIETDEYNNRQVVSCGFVMGKELICCPVIRSEPDMETTTVESDERFVVVTPPDIKTNAYDRPAVRACQRIERDLAPALSHHILGGVVAEPAEPAEYPHMVGIGYSRIGGDNRPPYDIRCSGTLIDKRFVLTAAHCVSERDNVPAIVRLGVVNFTDPREMRYAVEMRIKETYIHDDYSNRSTYNDIAILELERDVEFSEYIYPVCLYTNVTDPDTKIKLWVTGWGTVNTSRRSFSNILLKVPLHTSPLENCNKSFTEYGLNRSIPEGIKRTQFCAAVKYQIKDVCQGQSGGPLNLIVDEAYKNYRLVGVVSSGFGCASSSPGLYTRVAAFLDFIEKIVWPNGGD